MKRARNTTIFYFSALLLMMHVSSCKKGFLDQIPDDRLSLDAAFTSRKTAEQFLANTYSYLPDDGQGRYAPAYGPSGPGGLWIAGSDEAEYDWGWVGSQDINNGAYDASSANVSMYWNTFYRGIRSATYFIANVDKVQDLPDEMKVQYKAEARALRALYYFYLMRIYGPVVLVGDQLTAPDAPASDFAVARNSFDECTAYVTNELEIAIKSLPGKSSDPDLGRMTSGFAMAMRSEALLYAASPLFNGNTDYSDLRNRDGQQLISQQYDAGKWKKAADAAKAFIELYVPEVYNLFKENDETGTFSPYLSCRDVMLYDWNSEIIYANTNSQIFQRQYETCPYHQGYPSQIRGSGGLGATQQIVDAFFMANGRSITDAASGYRQSGFSISQPPNQDKPLNTYNQWVGREPRFYVDITYNGSQWLDKEAGIVITDLTYHGNSGRFAGGNDYSPTGYIVRKNAPPYDRGNGNRTMVMLRLAEIYLNYAEALNEYNPSDPDILKYLNLVRARAGIPGYGEGLPAPSGQNAMREVIRHERQVELCFESNRFFDVRRWKIGEETQAGPMYGLDINSDEPNFYHVVPFETRVFAKRSYLFPIPQQDVSADPLMVQNPGW